MSYTVTHLNLAHTEKNAKDNMKMLLAKDCWSFQTTVMKTFLCVLLLQNWQAHQLWN